jgi:hypothetical protein
MLEDRAQLRGITDPARVPQGELENLSRTSRQNARYVTYTIILLSIGTKAAES